MTRFMYILDAGHGGINPETGKYVTSGKRSPKFDDGSVFYEGVNNRDNVTRLYDAMKAEGMQVMKLVDTWKDIPLSQRTNTINQIHKEKKCIVISVHSNGAGNGRDWYSAKGIEVFTSIGDTGHSDDLANTIMNELICQFDDTVKWRVDTSDGDLDKESQFWILRKTNCPSVLLELGFHTNKEECIRMQTEEFKTKCIQAVIDAIKSFEDSL